MCGKSEYVGHLCTPSQCYCKPKTAVKKKYLKINMEIKTQKNEEIEAQNFTEGMRLASREKWKRHSEC